MDLKTNSQYRADTEVVFEITVRVDRKKEIQRIKQDPGGAVRREVVHKALRRFMEEEEAAADQPGNENGRALPVLYDDLGASVQWTARLAKDKPVYTSKPKP